jgi:hypothetical protein
MPDSKNVVQVPQLGFWEKADLPFVHASVVVQALYAAITGFFRGKAGSRKYSHHVTAAAIRGMVTRISIRQKQYVFFLFASMLVDLVLSRDKRPVRCEN